MLKVTVEALEDYDSDEVTLVADSADELAERLFDALDGLDNGSAAYFHGDFPFETDRRFVTWLASTTSVVSDFGSEPSMDADFGNGPYSRDGDGGPRLAIDPDVGTDTGHRIAIRGVGHVLIRGPDGTHRLFTPAATTLLASESWDNGWGSAHRYLGLRDDGLLEGGCTFEEGPAAHYRLNVAPTDDLGIAKAVIGFNRGDTCGFTPAVDCRPAVHALLDGYLTGTDVNQAELGLADSIVLEGDYGLTDVQCDHARRVLGL